MAADHLPFAPLGCPRGHQSKGHSWVLDWRRMEDPTVSPTAAAKLGFGFCGWRFLGSRSPRASFSLGTIQSTFFPIGKQPEALDFIFSRASSGFHSGRLGSKTYFVLDLVVEFRDLHLRFFEFVCQSCTFLALLLEGRFEHLGLLALDGERLTRIGRLVLC